MDMTNISDASFGERTTHFLNGMIPSHASLEERASMYPFAEKLARNEMVDEIHVMLRELIKNSTIIEQLNKLTNDERMEIFGKFCNHCGNKDHLCQCWNDE